MIPTPPYYAVIFTSRRPVAGGDDGYAAAAERMAEIVRAQPGFLGMDSARGADGLGITVCYWDSLKSIGAWKANAEHEAARAHGRTAWYEAYDVRVAKVERQYGRAVGGGRGAIHDFPDGSAVCPPRNK